MAKRITPEEREQIIALFPSGLSCRQIAEQTGRSIQSVSNIAREEGHVFGRLNVANARIANLAYGAERRANVRMKTVESVEKLLGQMFAPATIHNFGGKNNTYNSRDIDEPVFRDKQSIAQSIATLWRVVEAIDKAEETQNDTTGLDRVFEIADRMGDEYELVQPEAGVEHIEGDGAS